MSSWTFLTSHAHVLLAITRDRAARTRDISEQVGITERAVQRIIADLEATGYLSHGGTPTIPQHDEWATSRRYMSSESLARTRLHAVPERPGVTDAVSDTLELAETAS